MKKTLLLTLAVALGAGITTVNAQNVNIPDANFKTYLVGQNSINTNADNEIQVSEAVVFTGIIDCEGLGITDLTGIEAFTALNELICGDNPISTLNLSSNTSLTRLGCYYNSLASLDLSNNTLLTRLNCSDNQITTLNVNNNIALERLDCENNLLTSLNVSNNTQLTSLNCNNNSLTQLNISSNTALNYLECENNQLTSLNVSNNTQLIELYCNGNALTSLSVNNNIALEQLGCGENQLAALDVSNNTALIYLGCENNQLTQLNVKNGNNANFTDFSANNNPNLTCIQVDNAAFSTANWTDIDAAASYSEDCTLSAGSDYHSLNSVIKLYPNPTTGSVFLSENYNVTLTDLTGKIIIQLQNTKVVDISNQPTGMYFILLTDDKGQISQRSKVTKE